MNINKIINAIANFSHNFRMTSFFCLQRAQLTIGRTIAIVTILIKYHKTECEKIESFITSIVKYWSSSLTFNEQSEWEMNELEFIDSTYSTLSTFIDSFQFVLSFCKINIIVNSFSKIQIHSIFLIKLEFNVKLKYRWKNFNFVGKVQLCV